MPATDLEAGPQTLRPKTLTTSSLLRRAGIGLLILIIGTVASAWLYDASIQANALSKISATSASVNR